MATWLRVARRSGCGLTWAPRSRRAAVESRPLSPSLPSHVRGFRGESGAPSFAPLLLCSFAPDPPFCGPDSLTLLSPPCLRALAVRLRAAAAAVGSRLGSSGGLGFFLPSFLSLFLLLKIFHHHSCPARSATVSEGLGRIRVRRRRRFRTGYLGCAAPCSSAPHSWNRVRSAGTRPALAPVPRAPR